MRAVRTAIARIVGLLRSLFGGGPDAPVGWMEVEVDESVAALDDIEHVVVLMLENRSFDHMLGYLDLEEDGLDIDGLRDGMANEHDGRSYPIFRLERTAFTKEQDPCHSGACVDEQLASGNGGFAANYIETRTDASTVEPVVVMGYYDGEQLPIYDFLARRFCVCDRWFCSVRGATFPNRLYAVAGRAAGSRDNTNPPVYHLPSFVRHLDAAGATGAGTRTRSSRPSGRSTATICRRPLTTCVLSSRRSRSETSSQRHRRGRCPTSRGSIQTSWISAVPSARTTTTRRRTSARNRSLFCVCSTRSCAARPGSARCS